ncbi:MAG: hypothetical protein V1736_09815 [Pseudomonadota bacterium]
MKTIRGIQHLVENGEFSEAEKARCELKGEGTTSVMGFPPPERFNYEISLTSLR